MLTASKPLLSLKAADLMSGPVVALPADMSLPAAARMLSRAQISGAPVVDAEGRCIGVLSVADFVTWAQSPETRKAKPLLPGCVCAPWQIVDIEELPNDLVRNRMTADRRSGHSSARHRHWRVLARMMIDAHIHRVIVVDADNRPLGVVSSTDVLAAVARAEHLSGAGHVETIPWTPPKKG